MLFGSQPLPLGNAAVVDDVPVAVPPGALTRPTRSNSGLDLVCLFVTDPFFNVDDLEVFD